MRLILLPVPERFVPDNSLIPAAATAASPILSAFGQRRRRRRSYRVAQTALIGCIVSAVCGCGPQHPPAVTQSSETSHPTPAIADSAQATAGPTAMSHVPGGYELINRQFRAVISEQTGDVIYWGYADKVRNVVQQRGIYTTLSTLPDVPAKGSVEQRDEDTWQFMGDDDNHITWRKIYRLAEDRLEVSIMIQNNRKDPLDTAIRINGDLPGVHAMNQNPELFKAFGDYGVITLEGWNVVHTPNTVTLLPLLLQSDLLHLAPGERNSYTSMWMLSQ